MAPKQMGRRDFGTLALGTVGAAALSSRARAAQAGWTSLWNGRDLTGWTTWMQRPEPTSDVPGMTKGANGRYADPIGSGRDPLKVFTVAPNVDGKPAIRISGECFGELRTTRSFKDYHLKFEFKWGEKKWPPRDGATTQRDSGLLYHVHAEPGAEGRTWARSIELQIQERDVGDLYAVGSVIAVRSKPQPVAQQGAAPTYIYDAAGGWNYFSQVPGQSGRCIKSPDAENPSGQWNTVELVCFGQDCIHIVNGKVVMRLYAPLRIDGAVPAPVNAGAIILQSEGAEVFYREVSFRTITAIPAEYKA